MALGATIFKAALSVADMDRGHYADHALVIARHPSETDERMMVRVAAFALNADEALQFGKGLSSEDEAALWLKDLTGAIQLWIEVGLPDEKMLRKACSRSAAVRLYVYGRNAQKWWRDNEAGLQRFEHLSVYGLEEHTTQALAALAERTMQLQCTVQDGQAWFSDGGNTVEFSPQVLKT